MFYVYERELPGGTNAELLDQTTLLKSVSN